jgi:hypothetical protein
MGMPSCNMAAVVAANVQNLPTAGTFQFSYSEGEIQLSEKLYQQIQGEF